MDKKFSDRDKANWIEWIKFFGPNATKFSIISRNKKELVPFVGSGLSDFAGYPDWPKTIIELANLAKANFTLDELKKVSELVEKCEFYDAGDILRKNIDNLDILELLRKIFDEDKIAHILETPNIIDKLREEAVWYVPELSKNKKLCLTTNFDMVLEHIFPLANVWKFVSKTPGLTSDIAIAKGNDQVVLIKLHGSVGNVDASAVNIILSNDDAKKYYGDDNSLLVLCLESNILEHSLIFLGIGLKEDFTIKTLKKLKAKSSKKTHYAILPLKHQDNINERIKSLESMKVIPLFYPEDDELGHKWVAIILKWLIEGWKPYEGELEKEIELFRSKNSIFVKYNTRAKYYDPNDYFTQLMRFLDFQRKFLWWEICGAGDYGKTRLIHEIKEKAESQGWDVYLFDVDTYENDFQYKEFSSMHNTFLIFDDADFYYNAAINSEILDEQNEAHISYKNFPLSIQRLIQRSTHNKLRLLFTFTKNISEDNIDVSKKITINWWTSLSDNYHSFATSRLPQDPLELNWSRNNLLDFSRNFINQHYGNEELKDEAIQEFTNYISENHSIIHFTPFVCMMYIDAFFDIRNFEQFIEDLMDYLRNTGKKRYLDSNFINAFIKEHEGNFLFLRKRRSILRVDNMKNDSSGDGQDGPDSEKQMSDLSNENI